MHSNPTYIMKRVLSLTSSIVFALILSSCNQEQAVNDPFDFDTSNINTDDMRAREKNTKIGMEAKIAEINLASYEPVTDYTELVQGKLNTLVEIEKPSKVRLNVIDGDGRLLQSVTHASKIGMNNFQLDFSEMSLGQYYVVVLSDNVYRRFCVAKTE